VSKATGFHEELKLVESLDHLGLFAGQIISVLRAPATPSEPASVPDYAENDSFSLLD